MVLAVASPAQLDPALPELLSPWGHPLCDSLGFPLQAGVGGPPGRPDHVAGFGHLQKSGAAHLISWLLLFGAVPVCLLQAPRRSRCFRCGLAMGPLAGGSHPALGNKCSLPTGISRWPTAGAPWRKQKPARAPGQSWAHPGEPSWLAGWRPKATFFPLLSSGLPPSVSILFSTMSLIAGQTQRPSTRPMPEHQVSAGRRWV